MQISRNRLVIVKGSWSICVVTVQPPPRHSGRDCRNPVPWMARTAGVWMIAGDGLLDSGGGTVEADETFCGNVRSKRCRKPHGARGYDHKTNSKISYTEHGY